MIIEKLKSIDIEKYKNLIDASFGGSESIEKYKEKYDKNANYDIIVAKEDEKILGSVTSYKIELFTYSSYPALELSNICVLKEYRGQNIASKIFEYIINSAKENGYNSIYINCSETAYGAHKLYESMGFEKMSTVKYGLNIGGK